MPNYISNIYLATLLAAGVLSTSIEASTLADHDGAIKTDSTHLTAGVNTQISQKQLLKHALEEYHRGVLANGSLGKTISDLKVVAGNLKNSTVERTAAWLNASMIHWRTGDFKAAHQCVDAGLALAPSANLQLHKGRLLDSAGKLKEAEHWYKRALPQLPLHDQNKLQLRIALLAGNAAAATLMSMAEKDDGDFHERAARLLALMGKEADAIKVLKRSSLNGQERSFQESLQQADWAIHAQDYDLAKDSAVEAIAGAKSQVNVRYALSILVEAHRLEKTLPELTSYFAEKGDVSPEERSTWIETLQELKEIDKAIGLLRESSKELTLGQRQQLIDLYRDNGDKDQFEDALQELIEEMPAESSWVEALSLFHLEQRNRKKAEMLWQKFIDQNNDPLALLAGAEAMARLAMHGQAVTAANKAIELGEVLGASQFLFEYYLRRGKPDHAKVLLEDLDRRLPADSKARLELADNFDQLKLPVRALEVIQKAIDAGAELGTDAKIHLAWLQEAVGQHEKALDTWFSMIDNATEMRRRLVEDRIMDLAGRQAKLAEIALNLEKKLLAKQASEPEARLLTKIYIRAQDTGSATEVLEEFYQQAGLPETKLLQEKADIYRYLENYKAYDTLIRRLVIMDPEKRSDHLKSLILNQLAIIQANYDDLDEGERKVNAQLTTAQREAEKANRQKASERRLTVLRELMAMHSASDQAHKAKEFEAGVLSQAGFNEEAIDVYQSVIAENSDVYDHYLIYAGLLKGQNRQGEAIAMFQYLAEQADSDELLLVALDGLINMGADASVMSWGQRILLERLAWGGERSYLYEMLGDLASEERNVDQQIRALESSLPGANSRRASTLRQLVNVTAVNAKGFSVKPDVALNLKYSRRLIGLRLPFPPELYTGMANTFLTVSDPSNAIKAFRIAQQASGNAALLATAGEQLSVYGYEEKALEQYERAMLATAGDIGVTRQLAYLKERLGQLESANKHYFDALTSIIDRQAPVVEAENSNDGMREINGVFVREDEGDEKGFDHQKYYTQLRDGWLRTLPIDAESKDTVFQRLTKKLRTELDALNQWGVFDSIKNYPRFEARVDFIRYIFLTCSDVPRLDAVDRTLISHFESDSVFRRKLANSYREWGILVPEFLSELSQSVGDYGEEGIASIPAKASRGSMLQTQAQSVKTSTVNIVKQDSSLSDPTASYSTSSSSADWRQKVFQLKREGKTDQLLEELRSLALAPPADEYQRILPALKEIVGMAGSMLNETQNNEFIADFYKIIKRLAAKHPYELLGNENDSGELFLDVLEKKVGRPLLTGQDLMARALPGKSGMQGRFDATYIFSHMNSSQRVEVISSWLNHYRGMRPQKNSRRNPKVSLKYEISKWYDKALAKVLEGELIPDVEAQLWLELVDEILGETERDRLSMRLWIFAAATWSAEVLPENLEFYSELGEVISEVNDDRWSDNNWLEPNLLRLQGSEDAARELFLDNVGGIGNIEDKRYNALLVYMKGQYPLLLDGKSKAVLGYLNDQQIKNRSASESSKRIRRELIRMYAKTDPGLGIKLLKQSMVMYPQDKISYIPGLLRLQEKMGNLTGVADLMAVNIQKDDFTAEHQTPRLIEVWRQLDNPEKILSLQSGRVDYYARLQKSVASENVSSIKLALQSVLQTAVASEGSKEFQQGVKNGNLTLSEVLEFRWPGSESSILEGAAQYDFSVEVMERFLQNVSAKKLDEAARLFSALAQAHWNHGSAEKREQALFEQLSNKKSTKKQRYLWVALLAHGKENIAQKRVGMLNRMKRDMATLSYGELQLLAKGFSVIDDQENSFACLSHYGKRLKSEAEKLYLTNFSKLFSAAELFNQARIILDENSYSVILQEFVKDITVAENDAKYEYFKKFVLQQWILADASGRLTESASEDLRKIALSGESSSAGVDVMIAILEAQVGPADDVISVFKRVMSHREETNFDGVFRISSYISTLYGDAETKLTHPGVDSDGIWGFQFIEQLLQINKGRFKNQKEFLISTSRKIPDWLETNEVDKSLAVQVLAVISQSLQEIGETSQVKSNANYLDEMMASPETLSTSAIGEILNLRRHLSMPSLGVEKYLTLLRVGGLSAKSMRTSAAALLKEGDFTGALHFGDEALEYTQSEGFYKVLEQAALKLNDVEKVQVLESRRAKATVLRKNLGLTIELD